MSQSRDDAAAFLEKLARGLRNGSFRLNGPSGRLSFLLRADVQVDLNVYVLPGGESGAIDLDLRWRAVAVDIDHGSCP